VIRTLWNVLAALAVLNLLALLGLAGWAYASGRLDADRLQAVREALTTPADQPSEAERAKQATTPETQQEAKTDGRAIPVSSAERLIVQQELQEVAQQRLERSRRAVEDLRRTLEKEWQQLDEEIAEFERRKEAFEQMRRRIEQLEGDEQFKKTLRLYESVKPDEAAAMLMTLHEQGQTQRVVAYLDAMQTRKASKIIEEFEPALAADLLERLRTRGLRADAPEEP